MERDVQRLLRVWRHPLQMSPAGDAGGLRRSLLPERHQRVRPLHHTSRYLVWVRKKQSYRGNISLSRENSPWTLGTGEWVCVYKHSWQHNHMLLHIWAAAVEYSCCFCPTCPSLTHVCHTVFTAWKHSFIFLLFFKKLYWEKQLHCGHVMWGVRNAHVKMLQSDTEMLEGLFFRSSLHIRLSHHVFGSGTWKAPVGDVCVLCVLLSSFRLQHIWELQALQQRHVGAQGWLLCQRWILLRVSAWLVRWRLHE